MRCKGCAKKWNLEWTALIPKLILLLCLEVSEKLAVVVVGL